MSTAVKTQTAEIRRSSMLKAVRAGVLFGSASQYLRPKYSPISAAIMHANIMG